MPCEAKMFSDRTICIACGLQWDTNDPAPPACKGSPGCVLKEQMREDEKEALDRGKVNTSAYEELRRRVQAQREDLDDTAARGVLYKALREILDDAFKQASAGKGEERHGRGLPFEKQPILELARMLGSIDGQLQQVMKKSQEASHMAKRGEKDRAETELLGAIVYAAAAVRILREQD